MQPPADASAVFVTGQPNENQSTRRNERRTIFAGVRHGDEFPLFARLRWESVRRGPKVELGFAFLVEDAIASGAAAAHVHPVGITTIALRVTLVRDSTS